MIRPYRRPLALLALLTILASGPAHASFAQASAAQPARRPASSCASGVAAPAFCDRALGVALTIPTGWSVTPPGHFPPGALAFWTVVPGRQNATLHLIVEPVGLAQHCGDAQAATAVADALTAGTNSSRPILRDRNTVADAPAVFLSGLPGAGPSVQIIVAHNGAVYHLIFPGTALQPDQRLALTSLHFIPRAGPFPRVVDPGLTPALRACATVQTERLTLADALGTNPLTLYADGAGFPASRAVTVRLFWQGTPLPRQRPRYTSYTAYQTVLASSQGALTARLSVPARATAFAAFTVRVVATDARSHTTLATVARTFKNSNGMLTPAPPAASGSVAGASIFCVNRPATGRVALIPQAGGGPPLARFVVHGLPPRVIIAIFVDQGTDREAYNITRGVLSDATGALVRDVPTFRPPEKTPRRLLLTSFTGTTAVVDASASPCP